MQIDYETAASNFRYDADSGLIFKISGRNAGRCVGHKKTRGYLQIEFEGKRLHAHRLAWLLFYKCAPNGVIDHIDGVTSNNKISNLRCVSHSTNLGNIHKPQSSSTTGYRGVSKKAGRYRAAFRFNCKTYHIGTFDTAEEAHAAYVSAKAKTRQDMP